MDNQLEETPKLELNLDSKGPVSREAILEFEKALASTPGATVGESPLCPVKHHFAPGVYSREMFITKGFILVGKIHKHAHHSFLMKGDITVISEHGGIQRLKAPMVILSEPGAKRIGYANEDTIWVTVHPTNETDIKKIEEEVIAPSYEDFAAIKGDVAKLIKSVNEAGV